VARWKEQLRTGTAVEREQALAQLIGLGAEEALVECLTSNDSDVVQMATNGLWECWLNEEGAVARRQMNEGIELMNAGDLESALEFFGRLIEQYPSWAEAYNKQATVLYLLGSARLSLKVCRMVVELKPHHFGAWNGMALCAAQLERWKTVLEAARKSLSLHPDGRANLDLIQLAQRNLAAED
jgi:tetratricopeptide (TPR) repeat protein